MANDPYTVTMEQVRTAFRSLGIEDIQSIREVTMEPGMITVQRMRRDQSGQAYPVPGYHEIATETVTIAVVD